MLIAAGRCFDSASGYVHQTSIQAAGSILFQKLLYEALDFAIITLAEVVITNMSFRIDDVLRRPVFVIECLSDPIVAVDGNRVGHLQLPHRVFHIDRFVLE